MRILALGDVVGKNGCEALRKALPTLRKEKNIDMVIANGENSADGNGILPSSAEHLFTSGVDVITGGNHTFRRRELYDMLDDCEFLLRPANYPSSAIGHGECIYDLGRHIIGVVNLIGCIYMESMKDPLSEADEAIQRLKDKGADIIMVDFHAEATSEKRALGYYLDGRVSSVFGTHTHVQTNDDCILPRGTGYITDLGMCGPSESVLGVKPEIIIEKLRSKMPIRFENAAGKSVINGCVFNINEGTLHTDSTEKIRIYVN